MGNDKGMEELFLHIKPVQILISLQSTDENYASTVAKIVDCTYSHTMKILETLHADGMVSFEKKGRVKFVSLTDRGQIIARDFEKIVGKL